MTSEGMGEMFEGNSADTCAVKFPLVSMGGERRVSRAQTQERGPPSALVEIFPLFLPGNNQHIPGIPKGAIPAVSLRYHYRSHRWSIRYLG